MGKFALLGALLLFFTLAIQAPGQAIWHFPSRPCTKDCPEPRDTLPLAAITVGVIVAEAALFTTLEGTQSRVTWSQALFLAAAAISILLVAGDYIIPLAATGVARSLWIFIVALVVQGLVLKWAGPWFIRERIGVAVMGRTLLIPSALAALVPLVFSGLYPRP